MRITINLLHKLILYILCNAQQIQDSAILDAYYPQFIRVLARKEIIKLSARNCEYLKKKKKKKKKWGAIKKVKSSYLPLFSLIQVFLKSENLCYIKNV